MNCSDRPRSNSCDVLHTVQYHHACVPSKPGTTKPGNSDLGLGFENRVTNLRKGLGLELGIRFKYRVVFKVRDKDKDWYRVRFSN